MYPCDLHAHTTRSDGNDTPEQIIESALARGLTALAITDHDITPPETIGDTNPIAYAQARGLTLILGYEFSCDTNIDDIHICGYNLDWTHPRILAEVQAAKMSKSEAYKELCEILASKGMPVSWEDDVLTFRNAAGEICRRKPEEVQRKHIFEAMALRGYTPTWAEAKILVRDTPELNNKRKKIDPFDAIALIHDLGGTAVLAHPYLIDETLCVPHRPARRQEFIMQLFDAGLDGIEASYTYNKTSYKGTQTPEEIEREIRALYAGRAQFFSGGSDYHADHKKGVSNARQLGERGLDCQEFQIMYNYILTRKNK